MRRSARPLLAASAVLAALGLAAVLLLGRSSPSGDRAPGPAMPTSGGGIPTLRLEPAPEATGAPRIVLRVSVLTASEGAVRPVESAAVLCLRTAGEADGAAPAAESAQGTTGSDGSVEVALPRAGLWNLTATARGYVGTSQAFRLDGDAGGEASVGLRLTPLCVIEGHVRSSRGAPIEGALVVALPPPETARLLPLLHPEDRDRARRLRAQTDAEGAYLLDTVPPGVEIVLQVRHDSAGRTEVAVPRLAPGESRRVAVELKGRTILRGRVEGPWLPAEECSVECWHREGGRASQLLLQAQASVDAESGAFELVDLTPGTKTLHYARRTAEALHVGWLQAVAVEGETRDVGLLSVGQTVLRVTVLPEGGAVDGGLVRLGGQAVVPGAAHEVHPFRVLIRPEQPYTIHGLPAGLLNVSATLMDPRGATPNDRFEPATTTIPEFGRVSPHEEVLVLADRRLETKGLLSAVLAPPPDLRDEVIDARLVLVQGGRVVHTLPRSNAGITVFPLGRHEPGDVEIHVAANGWRALKVVTLRAGRESRVEIGDWRRAATFEGRVLDREGAGVPRAVVAVVQQDPAGRGFARLLVEVDAAEDGTFRVPGLPPLPHLTIQASGPTGATPRQPIDPDRAERQLQLRLP